MGIVFDRDGVLPRPWGEPRERRLPEADRKVDLNQYEREMMAAEEDVAMQSEMEWEEEDGDLVVDSADIAEEDGHEFMAPRDAVAGGAAPALV